MSSQNITNQTNTQLSVNTDLSKVFVYNNRYETDNYVNNSTYNPITMVAGTVMGRISDTGVVVPWTSTASDGSQYVLGILAEDITLASGASQKAPICIAGDVVSDKIICVLPGDNLSTVVGGRTLKDKIQGESVAIIVKVTNEMTDFDNS